MNAIPGVVEVLVDATGRQFAVLPEAGGDAASLIEEALQVLGADSRFAKESEADKPVEGFDPEEVWFGVHNIRGLSRLEARILATRWGETAAEEAGLPESLTPQLSESLRFELDRVFDHVHAQGGSRQRDWYEHVFPAAFERALARVDQLTAPQRDSVHNSLMRLLHQ